MEAIPYGRQHLDQSDIDQIVNVLKSDWLTQGPKVTQFESLIAAYCGAKFAVAVSSGTAALHLACLAAGLKPGDEAITTPISFVATANSVLYAGAKPVFADINYDSINIDPFEIYKKINEKTKVVLPVDFAGQPVDSPAIYKLAKQRNITVIDDACHALGAEYKNDGRWHKSGSCEHADMTVLSFHPVKHITTGEGGAITTNNPEIYKKLCALRTHGIYKDEKTAEQGAWFYDMRELGFNYRITDIQCALGANQFWKLDTFLQKRRQIAEKYTKAFSEMEPEIKLPKCDWENKKHAWHLYVLRFVSDKLRNKRKQIFDQLLAAKIKAQIHYIPIVWQSYYKRLGLGEEKFVNAERYYSECVSLPIYFDLTEEQQDYVISTVKDIVKNI